MKKTFEDEGIDVIKYVLNGYLTTIYKIYKNQKAILNLLLMIRIFYFLKISPLVSFYLKVIENFLKTFST